VKKSKTRENVKLGKKQQTFEVRVTFDSDELKLHQSIRIEFPVCQDFLTAQKS
jgi:hypothetical protein